MSDEPEVRRLVREELAKLLAPARADEGLRARIQRAMERDREVLSRLRRQEREERFM